MILRLALIITLMSGCDTSKLSKETSSTAVAEDRHTSSTAPVSLSKVPTVYSAPPAPDFWLIDTSGIALTPKKALKGRTMALFYSSWCPAVRSSLPKLLPILHEGATGYRIVGIFANNELAQLAADDKFLREKGISTEEQQRWKDRLSRNGPGTGLVQNEYAYGVDQAFVRFRMPRDQWESFGGRLGRLRIVCFQDGLKTRCPNGLDEI